MIHHASQVDPQQSIAAIGALKKPVRSQSQLGKGEHQQCTLYNCMYHIYIYIFIMYMYIYVYIYIIYIYISSISI